METPETPEINEQTARDALLKLYPRGFVLNAENQLTANEEATRIGSLDELSGLSLEKKILQFPLPDGRQIQLEVRPLTGPESSEIEDMQSNAPMPPPRKRAPGGKPAAGVREEYDFKDPDYIRQFNDYESTRRAAILSRGLLLEIPGSDYKQKAEYLGKSFPIRIVRAIESAILGLSTEPIERAIFI